MGVLCVESPAVNACLGSASGVPGAMDNAALFADFRLVMDEFRANGRDSPLEGPPEAAPVSCLPSHAGRQPPPSPPARPPDCEQRGILWSNQWRCGPDAAAGRYASATYDCGATCSAGNIIRGSGGATGELCGRVYLAEEPYGSVLIMDSRPTDGGGGGLRLPLGNLCESPLQRPPRSGRAAARKRSKQPNHCVFCKNNNELPCVYRNHILKDDHGRISCPILRVYTCPTCGANGDAAHTVKYCPQRQAETGHRLPPSPRPAGRPITKWGCR